MEIKPIPWSVYKSIKSRIIDAIGGEIGEAAGSIATSLEANASDGWIVAIAKSGISEKIPRILAELNNQVDWIAEDLVAGCCSFVVNCTEPVEFDSLHALDVLTLRNTLLNSEELAELFDAEKNCYLGAWKSVSSLLTGTSQTPGTDDAGGQDGSTSSPSPTTGDQAK